MNHRPSINFAIEYFKGKEDLVIAELGVSNGNHADNMYLGLKPKEMYLIDCYENDPGWFESKISVEEHQKLYQSTLNFFKGREGIHFLKKRSRVASLEVPKNSLDLIYIDASHDEVSVLIDNACWYPNVKVGGILCGHDFSIKSGGVKKALDRLFKGYQYEDLDWWYIKNGSEYD
jgi:hypothetical protein